MDKIIFALNLIVDFIDMNNFVNEGIITDYLCFAGLDDYEIRQVLAVLDMTNDQQPENFRIFSRSERLLLSHEAEHYLNKLIISGVLDLVSAEDVIERAFEQNNCKISVEQIKELTLITLLEKRSLITNEKKITEDYIQ